MITHLHYIVTAIINAGINQVSGVYNKIEIKYYEIYNYVTESNYKNIKYMIILCIVYIVMSSYRSRDTGSKLEYV